MNQLAPHLCQLLFLLWATSFSTPGLGMQLSAIPPESRHYILDHLRPPASPNSPIPQIPPSSPNLPPPTDYNIGMTPKERRTSLAASRFFRLPKPTLQVMIPGQEKRASLASSRFASLPGQLDLGWRGQSPESEGSHWLSRRKKLTGVPGRFDWLPGNLGLDLQHENDQGHAYQKRSLLSTRFAIAPRSVRLDLKPHSMINHDPVHWQRKRAASSDDNFAPKRGVNTGRDEPVEPDDKPVEPDDEPVEPDDEPVELAWPIPMKRVARAAAFFPMWLRSSQEISPRSKDDKTMRIRSLKHLLTKDRERKGELRKQNTLNRFSTRGYRRAMKLLHF